MMFKRVMTFSNVIPEAREAWKTFFRFSLAELAIWNPVNILKPGCQIARFSCQKSEEDFWRNPASGMTSQRNFYISSLFLSIFLAANASAASCNFTNLNFGINQTELRKEYKIDDVDVASEGDATITIAAREICTDLPEGAIVKFTLLDNKFVKLAITNKYNKAELFNYATRIFGERDDKEKHKPSANLQTKIGLWSKENYSVIYHLYNQGNKQQEKLDITAKKYESLFQKINKAKGQNEDDYVNKDKRQNIPVEASRVPDLPVDIGNSHKIEDHNKRVLKENENSRGFHYEE